MTRFLSFYPTHSNMLDIYRDTGRLVLKKKSAFSALDSKLGMDLINNCTDNCDVAEINVKSVTDHQ